MAEALRILAVHAHPDDESSKGAATTAKYVADGVRVMVVSCTDGSRGDVLNSTLEITPELTNNLVEVRRREMANAARVLGVEHTWLGFVDSGLPEGDPLPPLPEGCFALEPVHVGAEALTRVIRSFKPHVVLTYDENGGYPHPDHIMTHKISMAAWGACGDPEAFPHAGEPWQPAKVYYLQGFNKDRVLNLHNVMLENGMESPYEGWIANWDDRDPRTVTTRVECAEYFPVRDEALMAHATQIDPTGTWFRVPLELQTKAHPTEDFELAVSTVPVELPETDLLAGLPRDVDQADAWCAQQREITYDGRVERQ